MHASIRLPGAEWFVLLSEWHEMHCLTYAMSIAFLFVPAKYLFNLSRDKVLFDKQLLDAKNSQHCVGPYDTIFNEQFALKRLGSIFLRHKWIYLFSVPV